MSKVRASGLATAFALVMLGGSVVAQVREEPTPVVQQTALAAPVESTPLGQCRIQYDALPADRQPAAMECEHAHWLARSWGGRVMEKTSEGLVERATYEGRNDFTGVPSSELPRRRRDLTIRLFPDPITVVVDDERVVEVGEVFEEVEQGISRHSCGSCSMCPW